MFPAERADLGKQTYERRVVPQSQRCCPADHQHPFPCPTDMEASTGEVYDNVLGLEKRGNPCRKITLVLCFVETKQEIIENVDERFDVVR